MHLRENSNFLVDAKFSLYRGCEREISESVKILKRAKKCIALQEDENIRGNWIFLFVRNKINRFSRKKII
jgi:hypothetical protein